MCSVCVGLQKIYWSLCEIANFTSSASVCFALLLESYNFFSSPLSASFVDK